LQGLHDALGLFFFCCQPGGGQSRAIKQQGASVNDQGLFDFIVNYFFEKKRSSGQTAQLV